MTGQQREKERGRERVGCQVIIIMTLYYMVWTYFLGDDEYEDALAEQPPIALACGNFPSPHSHPLASPLPLDQTAGHQCSTLR